ncbi:MAG: Zn-dependent hydrolase [Synergistaceae bacterium]|nr:Zn-dependent hydrolase [Synergistaceae bacterium]
MENHSDIRINSERLERSLKEMGEMGFTPETGGRNRLALSDGDKVGRDLLCKWIIDSGFELRIDEIGNIFAYRAGTDKDAAPVIMGSHIDTVRDGGLFDGAYGVLGSLEVMRTLNDNNITTTRPVALAAFTNEEGARFQLDLMGSSYFTKARTLDVVYAVKDDAGLSIEGELKRIGYCGNKTIPYGNYFELHIEQGPKLDVEGVSIGAVEGIQGLAWWRCEYSGEANHAGSTPMELRHDTLLAAAEAAMEVEKLALRIGNSCVGTVGRISVEPDVINIVAGKCCFTVDFRQYDKALFEQGKHEVEDIFARCAGKRGLKFEFKRLVDVPPVSFDADMVSLVERKAKEIGYSVKRMYSGAGHDAQFVCKVCPAAMIFVPSKDGRSHCPEEWTDFADAAKGCNVLLQSVLELI